MKILKQGAEAIIYLENNEIIKHRIKKNYRINEIEITKLHDGNIIHGDLTTANFILRDNKIFIIDFGLGFTSEKVENKAVDLRVLKQALESKHSKISELAFNEVLIGYSKSKTYEMVVERLGIVSLRGRYKRKKK